MQGSRAPRVKGCHSQLWARRGGRRLCAMGTLHPRLSRGTALSSTNARSPHLGGRSEAARFMPNEQHPPEVRASAQKSSRQRPRPVQKAPPLRCEGCASAQKRSSTIPAARAWCIRVHQLGMLHSPIRHKNSLHPPTHPLTRGVMGAGSPQPGQGGATGSGPCARDGRCKHNACSRTLGANERTTEM